jgi:hypothetical protein
MEYNGLEEQRGDNHALTVDGVVGRFGYAASASSEKENTE